LRYWRASGQGPTYIRVSKRTIRYQHGELEAWGPARAERRAGRPPAQEEGRLLGVHGLRRGDRTSCGMYVESLTGTRPSKSGGGGHQRLRECSIGGCGHAAARAASPVLLRAAETARRLDRSPNRRRLCTQEEGQVQLGEHPALVVRLVRQAT
jgi:hypothetical protein